MATVITNEITARTLLERFLAMDERPALEPEDLDLLMETIAAVPDGEDTIYTADSLRRAVAQGWVLKAGLTASAYDIGGEEGYIKRDQWHKHCLGMANAYLTGQMGVLGDGTGVGGSGIGSLRAISSTAAYAEGR